MISSSAQQFPNPLGELIKENNCINNHHVHIYQIEEKGTNL